MDVPIVCASLALPDASLDKKRTKTAAAGGAEKMTDVTPEAEEKKRYWIVL